MHAGIAHVRVQLQTFRIKHFSTSAKIVATVSVYVINTYAESFQLYKQSNLFIF